MDRVLILLVVLAATAAVSAWWRAQDGRVSSPAVTAGAGSGWWAGLPVEAADIAAAVGATAPLNLVEFTAPDCVPCVRTKELLQDVAADRDGVAVLTLDVGDALDLVRAHRIMRAPTTLLISDRGHLLGRVAGVPRRDQLVTLLDSAREALPVA